MNRGITITGIRVLSSSPETPWNSWEVCSSVSCPLILDGYMLLFKQGEGAHSSLQVLWKLCEAYNSSLDCDSFWDKNPEGGKKKKQNGPLYFLLTLYTQVDSSMNWFSNSWRKPATGIQREQGKKWHQPDENKVAVVSWLSALFICSEKHFKTVITVSGSCEDQAWRRGDTEGGSSMRISVCPEADSGNETPTPCIGLVN